MDRILLTALLSLAAAVASASDVVVVVPVEISGMPPDVQSASVECLIDNAADHNFSQVMGRQTTIIPLVGGRFSGQIRVRVIPGGYPRGANPTADVRFYLCKLNFIWTCTSSSGGEGICTYVPRSAEDGSPGAALFRRADGKPFSYRIEGEIDPSTAVRLPRRFR